MAGKQWLYNLTRPLPNVLTPGAMPARCSKPLTGPPFCLMPWYNTTYTLAQAPCPSCSTPRCPAPHSPFLLHTSLIHIPP